MTEVYSEPTSAYNVFRPVMLQEFVKSFVCRRPRHQLQETPSPFCEREESIDDWKRALRANHPKLRTEIRMKDVLPGFRTFLNDVEYLRVRGSEKADNVDQVDELVDILLTKEKRVFEKFLESLWQQGYADTAARLAKKAGGRTWS